MDSGLRNGVDIGLDMDMNMSRKDLGTTPAENWDGAVDAHTDQMLLVAGIVRPTQIVVKLADMNWV